MNSSQISGFFAYSSSSPTLAEPIREAVKQLNRMGAISIKTWEDCRIGGKLIIQEICKSIQESSIFLSDLTGLNANVMFELGYAISLDKRIWLVLDTSYEKQRMMFEQLRILTTVGYASCTNSKDIIRQFSKEEPLKDLERTIFRDVIQPNLRPSPQYAVLYLKSKHDNEASIAISKRVANATCGVIVDDPRESAVQNITWYGQQIYTTAGVICHLINPEREGARLESAKYALVAGLAFGFGKPLLILAEGNFLAPVDYRDLLFHYSNSNQAVQALEKWLPKIEEKVSQDKKIQHEHALTVRLATELKGLRFGEYVAEHESESLINNYFVTTAAYEDALRGAHTVFVGRKGSGKTANLLKLQKTLSEDARNLVCLIKPAAYEMQGIVELLRRYRQRDTKGYAIASLWKFLLLSEILRSAALELKERDPATLMAGEMEYLEFVDNHATLLLPEFSVRLERCVDELLRSASKMDGTNVGSTRTAISETLHTGLLRELRIKLPLVLRKTKRVAILVDNLDKAWEKETDLDVLAEVLLGLLSTASDIPRNFLGRDSGKEIVILSLAIFLRSDIFYQIRRVAREPDKISYSRLEWEDRNVLRHLIEERFVASHEGNVPPDDLWNRYFCHEVDGHPTKEYIFDTILSRPRDLIFLVNSAVSTAVNRRHMRVEPEDIKEAESQYSLYALESILVENTMRDVDLESALFAFAGSHQILIEPEVRDILKDARVAEDKIADVISLLCGLTFLGVEVAENRFEFPEDPQRFRRDEVQARRFAKHVGRAARFQVHPAFRAFLDIQ